MRALPRPNGCLGDDALHFLLPIAEAEPCSIGMCVCGRRGGAWPATRDGPRRVARCAVDSRVGCVPIPHCAFARHRGASLASSLQCFSQLRLRLQGLPDEDLTSVAQNPGPVDRNRGWQNRMPAPPILLTCGPRSSALDTSSPESCQVLAPSLDGLATSAATPEGLYKKAVRSHCWPRRPGAAVNQFGNGGGSFDGPQPGMRSGARGTLTRGGSALAARLAPSFSLLTGSSMAPCVCGHRRDDPTVTHRNGWSCLDGYHPSGVGTTVPTPPPFLSCLPAAQQGSPCTVLPGSVKRGSW